MEPAEDVYQKLVDASLRFVSIRLRSQSELIAYLKKRLSVSGVANPEVVDRVMSRLSDLGYADDRKFALWLVQSRRSHKPKGRRAIKLELKEKGVPESLIDSVFDEVYSTILSESGPTEPELAKKAVAKKLVLWQKLPVQIRKRRIYEFLVRRGFASEIAYSIIAETVTQSHDSFV